MLTTFDWLRCCESGAELIATTDLIKSAPDLFPVEEEIGPPVCGIDGPCMRCWIYPRLPESSDHYCKTCEAIISKAKGLGRISRDCMIVWGFVNFLPDPIKRDGEIKKIQARCLYLLDENHFMLIMLGHKLKDWLREVLLYHGSELKGLMLLFPTIGKGGSSSMGDILCRAIHQDSRFPMDRLRIRFFSRPAELKFPHRRENQGILTFEASEFLGLLEMATIFRAQLLPNEQDMVREAVSLKDNREKSFYWGRLMGFLRQEARDMLTAWKFKEWPENRIRLLYELVAYAPFTP
ncbi:MAG: hypothetical protein B5M55_05085 [Desulfococcus sp. 4484_242]|nr:MAG: hypothetical protein B5M55_05085 [Desulfococcus sp. 4484_242]